MEAICSSETSVETQRTTRRHIPEDYTLQWNPTSQKTHCLHYENQGNNRCEKNADIMDVKVGGIYNNHCALKWVILRFSHVRIVVKFFFKHSVYSMEWQYDKWMGKD
jgi:hypothetical protein